LDDESSLLSRPEKDEESPKTLLSWLKATTPVIKMLIAAGLIIILGNLLIIAYVSSVTTGANVDSGNRDDAPVDGKPTESRKPMDELAFEKHFVDYYEKSMLLSGRMIQLADVSIERDDDWQRELSVDITLLKTLANGVQEVVPPESPGYKTIHEISLAAFADFKWAADNLMAASVENDKALQAKCVNRLTTGRERMNKAVTNLKDVYSRD
jgi:hypothetical protein